MTFAEFLLARIAEDEAEARDDDGTPTPVGMWDPDRVLAECEAKRRIVELHPRCDVHDRPGDECDACLRCGDGSLWPCDTLLALGSVYADRPDFDPRWRA